MDRSPAVKLEKAEVLPLALDDSYEFRKKKLEFYDGTPLPKVESEPILFERSRREHGAVSKLDLSERYGSYFSFFWRTSRDSDVTFRLEYRQAALGNYVLAQERSYPAARGSYQSNFEVIGDDFLEYGRVTSWRALLIVDGKIVAFQQSYIWR